MRTAPIGSLAAAFLGLLGAGSVAAQVSDPSVVVLRGTQVSVASFQGSGRAQERVVEHGPPEVEIHRGPRVPPEPRRRTPPPEPVVVYVVSETYVTAPVAVAWPGAHVHQGHARVAHHARHPRAPLRGGPKHGFLPRSGPWGDPLGGGGHRSRGHSHGGSRRR
jgi:hypothetical protein